MRSSPAVVVVVVAGAMLPGCDDAATRPAVGTTALPLEPCRLEGLGAEAFCGTFDVAEDRARPNGRKIGLRVAVVPARSRTSAPDPVFLLVGGPGQAATEAGPMVVQILRGVARRRAFVLVDQRGTGGSSRLACAGDPDDLAEMFGEPFPLARLRACLAGYDADVRHYTTPVAADDLEEVRAALGYDRINLWGGSYGTRVALVYARRYPDRVRTLTLDGVAPASIRLPLHLGVDGQASLDRLLADCEADAQCRGAFPTLGADVTRLLSGLEVQTAEVVLRHPRTGEPAPVSIGRDDIALLLRAALYSPELGSLVPTAVHAALSGDYGPFAAIGVGLSSGADPQGNMGMFLSVVCNEDVPRITPADIVKASAGNFLGRAMLDSLVRACEVWPRAELPAAYWEPVQSAVPALVLSGGIDPATPPRWGEDVLAGLSSARHFVAASASHGVTVRGCARDLVEDHIAAGSAAGLDPACLADIERPAFFLTSAGPPP